MVIVCINIGVSLLFGLFVKFGVKKLVVILLMKEKEMNYRKGFVEILYLNYSYLIFSY